LEEEKAAAEQAAIDEIAKFEQDAADA